MKSLYVPITVALLLSALHSVAQVNIIDPYAANSPDIHKCSGSTNLQVVVQFGTNGSTATVSLPMPTGVQYVAGSVTTISQSGGLSIAQTSSAANNPLLTITAGDGTINATNEIRFQYKVKADCAIAPGTLIFPVNLTFNGVPTSGEVQADVLQADLNLTTHPQTAATIGVPVTVPILIQNGGLGQIDSLDFVITESGMTTTNVVVNAIPSTLISNVAGVRRYRIYSNALPGGKLNNPETITVLRTVVVQSCVFSSNYATNWGCNGTLCQSPEPYGPGEFVLTSGSPNVQMTATVVQSSNLCTQAIVDIKYQNNGSGPANAAAAFNLIFKAGMNSATGWSSSNWSAVSVTMNGNPITYTGGSSGLAITLNANQFSADPDGAGGLADIDLDGKFDDLPNGAFITLRVTLAYVCPSACPAPNETANLVSGAMYSDQCAANLTATGPGGFSFGSTAIGAPVVYVPATVSDGQIFNAEICLSRAMGGAGINCPTNKIKFDLTLPAGVTATGIGTINGVAAVVNMVGSTVTVSGPFQSGLGMCLSIQLTYACNATPLDFSYAVSYQCAAACACIQQWACGTFSITPNGCIACAVCPPCPGCAACPDGGLTIGSLQVRRTTLGYTDHTGTTRVTNPATLPPLSLLKVMPCDTVKFTMASVMNGGTPGTATFDNAYLEISYDRLSGNNLLGYGSGTYRYFDASSGLTTTGALPAPTSTVIAGRHVMLWNFNAILPGGLMQPGDSIIALPRFVVLNNTALTVTPTRPGNAYAAFFNLTSSAGNPLPGGSPRFTCGGYVPEFYLHAIKPLPLPIAGSRSGCGTYPVSGALNNEVTLLFDEYPGEIRPVEIIKSVKVQIQNGDSYDPSVQPVLLVYGSATDDPWYAPGTFNLPAPTISGNMITWTNPGNWPVSDMAGTDPAQTGYIITFNLKNSGCVNSGNGTLATTWNYDRFGYAAPACRVNVVTAALSGTVESGAPQHTLTNLTGSIYGTKKVECFQVEIKNVTAARESGYIWLALEDNLSPMDVVSVRNVTTNTILPLLTYANGKWVKLATNFPGGSSILLEICAEYNNCIDNLLTLKQGWDCSTYPTNPGTYTCGVTETTLRILPFMARVQGDFLATSPLPAMMCQDFVFDFRINSSQKADLFDPAVNVTLPPNMLLQSTVQIEYPLNSGNWQNATPTITGQLIAVDLTDHSGIGTSLPGTINADLVNFPGGEDRQAAVRFTVRTNCSYLSGDRILFQPLGNAACASPADGSGATFLSPRIHIFGAEPTYEGTFSINLGSPDNLYGCYAQKLDINVQLADVNGMDGSPAMTGSADTIILTLPSILDMVPGSFVCTTFPAANCPVFVDQTIGANGRRTLKFVLPPNISIPNGGVVPLVFSVRVQPQQEVACTVNDKITGTIIAVYENISCPNPPPGTVCAKVRALAGEGQTAATIKKMELQIENFFIACSLDGQIQYTAKIRVLNLPLATDSSFVVEMYCLDALGQPVLLVEERTVTGPKAVGSLITLTGTFAGCDPQNGVLVKIPLQTFAGAFQCHCAPIQLTSNNLPKCPSVTVTTLDNEICPYENATVIATLAGAASGGTWTSTGTGSFANPNALSTTYIPSTADKTAGLVTLTFTTNDLTGTCAPGVASVIIIIRPLPVVAPATLTVCATVSGGNSGIFNLTLADNLVDPQDVNVVTYYVSQANANTGTSPLSSPYTATNNTTIYARVVNATTGCFNTTTVLLKVNPWPTANPASLSVCEESPLGSGFGLFNLVLANNQVNSGAGIAITYHATLADAQNDINALSSPHTAFNGAIVYARVEFTATNCYATAPVTLNVSPSPPTFTTTLKVCAMGVGMLMAEFNLTQADKWVTTNTTAGPVPAGLNVTYHDSYSAAANDQNPLSSPYTSVTANVWVRVENATTGCYSIDIVQLVVLPRPVVFAQATDETCTTGQGSTNNGSVTALVTSGQPVITYDWSHDGPDAPDDDLATINGLASGIYTVTVTDGNGCTATGSVTINEATSVLATATVVSSVSCHGGNNGVATVVPSGGVAPYTFDWSSNGAQNPDTDPATITGLAAGTYTVTVTDAHGCTALGTVNISEPAADLSANITAFTAPTCLSAVAGSATVTATGGTTPYSYDWSGSPAGDGSPAITGLAAGSYLVVVTDLRGCTALAVADLDDPTGIDAVITSKLDITCYGAANGTASVTVTPVCPACTYNWDGAATPVGEGTPSVSGLAPGNHTVTVTDPATGCTAVAFVMLMQPAPLTATIVQKNVLCQGAANGSATVMAQGGTAPYTYDWNGSPTGDGSPIITGLSATTYTVTVTDANNCQTVVAVTINQPATLTVTTTNVVPLACFGTLTGSATALPAGGTAPYTYDWSNDGAEAIDNDPATVTGLAGAAAGTTYTVTVTDVNGCVATTSVVILAPTTAVLATISSTTNATCSQASGSATVLATGGSGPIYTYDWSHDGFENPDDDAASITNVGAGAYLVVVTDQAGCTATAVANVANPAGLSAAITAQANATCLTGANGSATVTAVGGTAPFDYDWSHTPASPDVLNSNMANHTLNNLPPGNYTITITDANNCTAIAFVVISATDVVAPVIVVCPTNITNLNCGAPVPSPYTTAAAFEAAGGSVSDNCTLDANLMICSSDFDNGLSICNLDGLHTIIRTYEILDQFNNKSTCTQTIAYLEDVTPPVLITPAANLPCIAGCLNGSVPPAVQNWLLNHAGAVATDACSAVIWTNNYNAVAAQALCSNGSTLSVTFTATDACGNAVQATADICISTTPSIGVAKRNVQSILNSDGSTNVTFEFNLENFGNVNLSNLTLIDDLAAAFPASCAVTVLSLTSDDFIVNAAFNGLNNNNLLAPNNGLVVDDKGAVLLTVRVANCGANQTSFINNAIATGTSPGGTTITDNSVNGSDPDGMDNDQNPDEASGTPVSFIQNPVLGVAKRNVQTVLNSDGSANVTFEFNLENFGNVNLGNLTLIDDLAAAFPASCAVTVLSLTSDDFIVNAGFNGLNNNNLLAPNNGLAVSDKGAVLLTIRVANCGANQTSFINNATVSGTSPGGTTITDLSVNGSDPDGTDNDQNPDEASGTPISFIQNPVLGVAKRNVQIMLNADGSAEVTFEFNLENFGNVNLGNLTLTDDLAASFPASCAVTILSLTSDDFIVNANFNGLNNNNLLSLNNGLVVGDKGAVLLTIRVSNCGANQTSFINNATATGTSPGGTTVTDNSVNGSDPDGTDNDQNPDEMSGTPVSFIQNPVLGVAKRNVQTILNADGSADVTFEFNLENFGNVNLGNLTLIDDLAAAFPASCAVTVLSITSDDFIVNSNFNGLNNLNLLASNNGLVVGDKGAVLLTIRVSNCGANQTSFINNATATGTSPGGTTVTDNSVNGSDPDGTDNDQNPDEASGTPVSFVQNPVLGVAKRNVQTILNADGSADVTFEFNLENFGNVNLGNLTLTDDLAAAFPASCVVTVLSLTSDDFIVNAGFNGLNNNNLLVQNNGLVVGQKGAVLLTVRVTNCGANQTTFINNATATGISPGGTTVTDNSVNGSDPDGTDNDQNPDEASGTPVSFIQNPVLGVAKRNVQTLLNADGSANVTFEFNLENFGNVNLSNLTLIDDLAAAFPASCAVTVLSLTSDDFIVNAAFNGLNNNNLLAQNNGLIVGDKGALLLTIRVANCGANQTSFINNATVSGTSPGGTTATDNSVNGSDPDGTDNDQNPDEASGTPVLFVQNPILGVAKRNVQTVLNTDGSANVTFEFNLENFGNVNLSNLTLIDDLAAAFPASCAVTVLSLTSDDFIVNAAFNGLNNNNLLASNNGLVVGDKGAILLTIRVANCGANQTAFINNATATGTSPGGTTVTDNSVNGSDPDGTDNDQNPDEMSGTPVSFVQNPILGVAKRNVQTTLNADGSANVTFEFNLENFGNVNLSNLTLIDDLVAAFPASCAVTILSLTSDDFIVNAAFNGLINNNLLAQNNGLVVGDKGAVLLTVRVANCGANQTAFINSATASGTSPGGTTVTDLSVNGSDPDGTDNDQNPGEMSGTPVSFIQNPILGVAKRNVQTMLNADGSANVTFELNLENFGNVNLSNLTLTDDLVAAFPASCAVTILSVTSDDFIVNAGFNGLNNSNLLAPNNGLVVGDKGAVLLTIRVANCGANQTAFINSATATGTSPGGTTVTDNSVNGSDPDGTDNDQNPDEMSGTPVSFVQNPLLGVAKRNVQTTLNTDGSANVTFEFNVENFGNVNLSNLTLTDELAAAFPASCAVSVLSLTSDDFIVNSAFNGLNNNNLLAPNNGLVVGDKGAILLTVRVANCGANQTSFINNSTVSGTSPGGTTVTDLSVNGPDPDGTDNDQNPDEASGTPVSFIQNPVLGVAKRNVQTVLNADGSANVTFEFNLENFGNVNLSNLTLIDDLAAAFPASCAVTVLSLTSDDFIVNANFNGLNNNNLLAQNNGLIVGDKGAVLLTVRVANCGANQTAFINSATVTGTSPGGTTITDLSVNGSDPDGTDNDQNPDEASGTPVSFIQNPVLGVAKRNVQTILNANGSANVTFEFNLENFGNVNLQNLTLVDDLAAAFPASCAVTVLSLTSDDFIVNANFNGLNNNNLLAQNNGLIVGDKGAVLLTIRVANCAANQTSFINNTTASGTSPGGTTVMDLSVNGSDPDGTDNDQNPDEMSGTPVSFVQNPVLGVAKRNVQTILNTDGSANVTFEFNLENFGNVNLQNLTLVDDLAVAFPVSCAVTILSLTSDDFIVNAGFNGLNSNNLLSANNILVVGNKGTVSLTIRVANCGANQTSFINNATASVTSPGGTTVTDNSVNGPDPDGTDNDQNPDEMSGTPVSFIQNPVLGVAKRNVQTVLNSDGSADVTFEFNLENFGNVNLSNLTLLDDLAAAFPASCAVTVLSLTSDDFIVNVAFNGLINNNLLAPNNGLAVGDKGAVLLTIRVANCGANQPSFVNNATATGTSPGGTTVTDNSVNGADPDGTDNDQNPDEASGTPVSFIQNAVLGLTKRVSQEPVLDAQNYYVFTYEIKVFNLGNVDLKDLSVVDNLAATFAGAADWDLLGLESEELAVNTAFNGQTITELLAPGNTLAAGDEGAIYVTVRVAPGALVRYWNTATGTGTGPGGFMVADVSDDGTNPDMDGDGNPNEPDENDSTPVDLACFIGIICPAVVSPIVVDNDLEWCNAMVNFPPAVPVICAGSPTPLIEYQLSGVGAEATANGVWIVGQPSGLRYRVGTTTVQMRARLGAVGTPGTLISTVCTFDIIVLDKQKPQIQCPGGIYQFGTDASCTYLATAAMNATASDNCAVIGGIPSLNFTYNLSGATTGSGTSLAGVAFQLGATTVTWTAGDNALPASNVVTCAYQVVVRDNDAPVIVTCPPARPVNVIANNPGDCTATVPNLVPEVVATDNCTTALTISQIPAAGTTFGAQHGDQGTVTITVMDAAGLVTTCSVILTIIDNEPPIFTNCPTTMLMFGNDVDQCAAKVNWSVPTADDNCGGAVSLVQTAGPQPGSVISVNVGQICGVPPIPDAPVMVTYKATDGRGLMSFCSFELRVLDTQLPDYDADIVMPGDITVQCHSVPAPFVLTNNDVHDNCTLPSKLIITYTEVSTQCTDPGSCCYYNYTLTRTWKVKDASCNERVHVQVITVIDTTKPVAKCKNTTITLDKTGRMLLDPALANDGSTDNCAAAPYLTLAVNPSEFTCAQLGPNQVPLRVTDPCGNFSICTATVTVQEGLAPCTPQYKVATRCLDNATTMDNGQLSDLITVKSLAMQTWTLTANTGFGSMASAPPPAVPTALPVGTLFTVGTADYIDNDEDGQTDEADEMVYYTLRGLFTETIGYDMVANNLANFGAAPATTTMTVANKAFYPAPYFNNLHDPYCLNTPPFAIGVGEYNQAAGDVLDMTVNNVPMTIFDAAALGEGMHTINATFDAGPPTTILIINGVAMTGTVATALANPCCRQKIVQPVQIVGTPTNVVCNDLVYVSLDANCQDTLYPDQVLEGTYYCLDDYTVELDFTAPFGNGPWLPARLTAADIGKTYYYHVVHALSGNICWGQVKIEDKLPPVLTCPANVTIACSESIEPVHTGQVVATDCSAMTTVIDDNYTDFGECHSPRGQIVRTWIVTDAWGNQATCSQTITITPFDLANVVFPPDVVIDCESTHNNPAATMPDQTGRPSINGFAIGVGGLCTASIGSTDTRLDICTGSYEILREWIVRNTCLPIGPTNPVKHTQVIRVKDFGGPVFACPPAVTVSTDPDACCATAALPDVIIAEGCSNISGLTAKVTGNNPNNGNIITFTVPGHLADFPANNWWTPDTLAVFDYTQCLPTGDYTVEYTAEDQCTFRSKCTFVMTVRDLVPPATSCDQTTVVSIVGDDPYDCYTPADGCDGAGVALEPAKNFDDGSHDNCNGVRFTVRRMAPYSACIEGLNKRNGHPDCNDTVNDPLSEYELATLENDTIKFYCCEVGTTQTVILRVYQVDAQGNDMADLDGNPIYNECMIQVEVQDKIKPVCIAPPPVNVNCANFDPTLWTYGLPTISDNCCLQSNDNQDNYVFQGVEQCGLKVADNYSNFDTVCNRGTIRRTFTVTDCHNLSTTCSQLIVVNYQQDYFVHFPDDKIVTVCDGTTDFGKPTFFGQDCELLATAFEDQIYTVVDDACYKIERTWTIFNWCTYNPNLPCVAVPNPNPTIVNSAADLAGPTVSACGNNIPDWSPTVVRINPTDPATTNYCSFYDPAANCYRYKQIIKVIDGVAPVAQCVPPTPCDLTSNDANLWNAAYYFDQTSQAHDLCEGPVDLTITATDACSLENLDIRYLLFLDLDGDGTMETVVNSSSPPPAGIVNFGNASNPNFTGGTPYEFDFRAVSANQKYRFALQTTTSGINKTGSVRWNTVASPNTYGLPELPYGTHKIKWFVADGCGNESVCEYSFVVKDCKPPTVTCLNGLSVNIMPTQMIQLWAIDFLQYAEDNCTPLHHLKYGLRRSGTGAGFPMDANDQPITSVTFTCADLGTQPVELWALDAAGNADFCETYVIVQDNNGNCPVSDRATVAGLLQTETGLGLEEATVEVAGYQPLMPPFTQLNESDSTGAYYFPNTIPLAANLTVTPTKDNNPLNGVTTYDLVLISRHILGLEPLSSPYRMIAADANKSGSITTSDMVELRKLILGIYTELPNNTSWRFVDKSFAFPNPANPFQTVFPENKTIADIQASMRDEDFVAVKIGDVNQNAIANMQQLAAERTAGTLLMNVEDRTVQVDETFDVTFKTAEAVQGFQFTLNMNGLRVLEIANGNGVNAGNFALFQGALTVSVNDAQEFTVHFRAEKAGKISEMLGVSSRITKAEGYTMQGIRQDLAIRFRSPAGMTTVGVGFELYQNQPNPFNAKTSVGFHLPAAATATLTVYDELGRVVFTQRGDYARGYNSIVVDAALLRTSGLLYYQLEAGGEVATRKMIRTRF